MKPRRMRETSAVRIRGTRTTADVDCLGFVVAPVQGKEITHVTIYELLEKSLKLDRNA